MKYATICSGIEAPSCAWHDFGWEPIFFSEIEEFPNAVLKHHFPNVPNLGDMTKYKEWGNYELDLIMAGTPCQAFSVAGLRKGLEDPRGNLTLVFIGIIKKYMPKYICWENVPGTLSVKGNPLKCLIEAFKELGYSIDVDILDAQFFGVPQRRRRIFLVGIRNDVADKIGNLKIMEEAQNYERQSNDDLFSGIKSSYKWDSVKRENEYFDKFIRYLGETNEGKRISEEILIKQKSVHWYSAESCEERERDSREIESSIGTSSECYGIDSLSSNSMKSNNPNSGFHKDDKVKCIDTTVPDPSKNKGGNCIVEAKTFTIRSGCEGGGKGYLESEKAMNLGGQEQYLQVDNMVCDTVTKKWSKGTSGPAGDECGNLLAQPIYIQGAGERSLNGNGKGLKDDGNSFTLNKAEQHAVAIENHPQDSRIKITDTFQTLDKRMGTDGGNTPMTLSNMQVRRITPTECERLQGFPDGWTYIPFGKSMVTDGHRYKAFGNSMAVPVVRWIGQRIRLIDEVVNKFSIIDKAKKQ